jgi:guanylate kinase
MENKTRQLIVITGATGSGKTFIRDYLIQTYQAQKVITHTTRLPREYEHDGVDYYFETEQSFSQLHLLENVQYVNARYGSSMEGVKQAFQNHSLAVIVLDTKGAITYAQKLGSLVQVWFVKVDDPKVLKARMLNRGDSLDQIQQRLASHEFKRDMQIPSILQSQATIIDNNHWDVARKQIDNIMQRQRLMNR